jgi:hypothetical protein
LLDAFVAPTFAAYCDITVVTANLDLSALLDEVAVSVNAGIDDSFVSAVAS